MSDIKICEVCKCPAPVGMTILGRHMHDATKDCLEAIRLDERERCAKLAEDHRPTKNAYWDDAPNEDIAGKIRLGKL